MAASKFTPEITAQFIDLIGQGFTIADAAGMIGISPKTVKSWITRGRRSSAGQYREFVDAVSAAREKHARSVPLGTAADLERVTWKAARRGSVQAMKLYWKMLQRGKRQKDPPDPFKVLDGGAMPLRSGGDR